MPGKLDGKVAVITGGASGMGLATVERFVTEGARVVFCDFPPESTESLVERLGAGKASAHHRGREKGGPSDGFAIAERLGPNVHFVPADVANDAELGAVVDAAVERFGGLDIMFNNAGVAIAEGSIIDCPPEIFDYMIAVDLRAVWMGMKFAAPHIIARGGGSIISTSSISALAGVPGIAAYTAAKSGVIGLTRNAASEFGPNKVRVNCICPGAIMTPITEVMFGKNFDHEQYRARAIGTQPMPINGESWHIASAALWLASDDSVFVTGQIIAVDGGASTHSWLNATPATALASQRL